MKQLFTFMLLFFSLATNSQTVGAIDSIVHKIDNEIFTDSIVIKKPSNFGNRPIEIKGYLNRNILMKTVAKFNESNRISVSYFSGKPDYSNSLIYTKDFDAVGNRLLSEIYAHKSNILKTNIISPIDDYFKEQPYILMQYVDYRTEIDFELDQKKRVEYTFTAILTQAIPLPPDCGTMAHAVLQKFKVVTTNYPNYNDSFVLIIQPCPESLGDSFFKDGKIYQMNVCTSSGAAFNFSYSNFYATENTPIFWSREAKKEN